MENLEDIVFDRLCRHLEKWKIDFRLCVDGHYYVYVDGNRVPILRWQSKKNVLTDISYNQLSFLHVCRSLNRIIAAGHKDVLHSDEIYLANMHKRLKMIEANSYEEMVLKMDLMGI